MMENNIIPEIKFTLNKGTLYKSDLLMLDILANNNWERPIYFSTTLGPSNYLNLQPHMQLEGLAYRLLPVQVPGAGRQGFANVDTMQTNLVQNMHWRELDSPDVFYDENYTRFPMNSRSQFYRLTAELFYNQKDKERAIAMADTCFAFMPDEGVPYDVAAMQFIRLYNEMGEKEKSMEIAKTMIERADSELAWFAQLPSDKLFYYMPVLEMSQGYMDGVIQMLRDIGETDMAKEYEAKFNSYRAQLQTKVALR
jgi:hypothetical protein